jgi:AraC-like DNA-binding protein
MMTNFAFPTNRSLEVIDKIHVHATYELFCVSKGKVYLHTEGETATVSEGNCLLVPPNTPHYTTYEEGTVQTVLKFAVKLSQKAKSTGFEVLRGDRYIIRQSSEEIAFLAKMTRDALEGGRSMLAGGLLLSLLTLLSNDSDSAKEALADNTTKRLYRLDEFLFYYSEDMCKLRHLAEQLHLSERHLSRLIKRECGTTFRRRLQTTRVEAAKRLLSEGKTVSAVAAAVGYSSVSAFYTAYKRHYGVAPGKERKKSSAKAL